MIALHEWIERRWSTIAGRLAALIRIPSIAPDEGAILTMVTPWLEELGFEVRREPMHPNIARHSAFTPHPRSRTGPDRVNLRARPGPRGHKRRVLFNCHADVVPGSAQFPRAFEPLVESDRVVGRGACDNKGNLVMLLEALAYVREMGLSTAREVAVDIVVEEEIGGNGTLSTVLHGIDADEVVVLEPTSLCVYRGHRGCVTFFYEVRGRPVHMGADEVGLSAVTGAMEVVEELRRWETELLQAAKKDPDFARWKRPLQVNVGRVAGGEWPGSVPAVCTLEGNAGFLPSTNAAAVMELLRKRVQHLPTPWFRENVNVRFPGLRTEAYIMPEESALVHDLASAAARCGVADPFRAGWNVSCDARLHHQLAGLPTVIFGAGHLIDAHSDEEKILFGDIATGAATLVEFLTGDPAFAGNTT